MRVHNVNRIGEQRYCGLDLFDLTISLCEGAFYILSLWFTEHGPHLLVTIIQLPPTPYINPSAHPLNFSFRQAYRTHTQPVPSCSANIFNTTTDPIISNITEQSSQLTCPIMTTLQFKASLDTKTEPVAQAVLDQNLFKLAKQDRLNLGFGPTFKLKLGDNINIHLDIPKRAAMALSKAFNDQLRKYPRASTFMLNPHQVTETSVVTLVDYIVSNSKTNKPFSINGQGLQFPEAIDLYRHGLIFGMDRHVAALGAAILEQINDDKGPVISYHALNELVMLPAHNRIYQAAVRKFEGLVHIKTLADDPEWTNWLKEHQKFAQDMGAWKVIREERKLAKRLERHWPSLGKDF